MKKLCIYTLIAGLFICFAFSMYCMDVHTMKRAKMDPELDLFALVKSGSIDKIQEAIDAGAKVNACDGDDGNTPLIEAAGNGHSDGCMLLIENKADMNAQNEWRERAILLAARRGHADIAELILKAMLLTKEQKKSIVTLIGVLRKRRGIIKDVRTLLGKWAASLERAKSKA